MLVINPDECISCGVCELECPIEAIENFDMEKDNHIELLKINSNYSKLWPKIEKQIPPLPNADDWKDKTNKLRFLLEENPKEEDGKGS